MSDKTNKPLTFKAKVGDIEEEYEFVIRKFQIPGIGVLTSEEALENDQALAELIDRKSSVINKVGSVNVADKAAAKKAAADAKAKAEADAKEKAEADAKAKAEADAKEKAEADAKAKAEAEKAPSEEKDSPKKKGGK